GRTGNRREHPYGVGGRRLPPLGGAPARPQRCAEHRPNEPGGLLPQLFVQVVPRRGRGARRGAFGPRSPGNHLRHALQGVAGAVPAREHTGAASAVRSRSRLARSL
ncbi:MAG: protein of unknown function DUF1244, partial [uncultured Acetobacteraceae bacterium]